MGVAELRWPGAGEMITGEGNKVTYSGGETANRGVGIIMKRTIANKLIGCWPISDRIIMMKLKGTPFNINVFQLHAPTEHSTEEELENFFEKLTKAREQCKEHEINIIMGDINAKVGRGRQDNTVGKYGLGRRSERGEKWIEWCSQFQQVISNTWHKHHPRKLWTWESPGGRYKNQIDYITITKRFRNAVTQVKTYPGANCNTDYSPVVAEIKIRLKKHQKEKTKVIRDINILTENQSIREYSAMNRYEVLMEMEGDDVQQQWTKLQTAVEEACEEPPKKKRRKKKPWMTENILHLMDERRKFKNVDERRYQKINKRIRKECLLAKEE